MNSRLVSIIRKEFIQIWRDPRTLAMILVIPVMQLFLLGYSATSDVRNIPIAVWDQNRSPESRALLDAFRAADYFRIAFDVGSETEIRDLMHNLEELLGQARKMFQDLPLKESIRESFRQFLEYPFRN